MTQRFFVSAARATAGAACLLLSAGCAKSPSNSVGPGPQLIVTMTVAGQLRPDYYYFVLFNVNNRPGPPGQTITAPIPVVAPPYGNGFAAGAFVAYVEYHGPQPDPSNFGFYVTGADLLSNSYSGVPQSASTQNNGATLAFQVPLARLASAAGLTTADITSLQINFVTTNTTPPPTDTLVTKYFDALGSPFSGNVNNPLLISNATQPNTYFNTTSLTPETSGDVAQSNGNGGFSAINEPDLDITNWTVQVTG